VKEEMTPKTRQIGMKTGQHTGRLDLVVENKDPKFDYSFCRMKDVEEGGGMTRNGYEPIGPDNTNGECWAAPHGQTARGGKGQIRYQDTILCRRPKDTSKYFKEMEDEQYNSQIRLVQSASKRANGKLRQIDPGLGLINVSQEMSTGKRFSQRTGPTEKETKEEVNG
jgi:hypothetical protein